jgi:solute carrier family 45 protein 1/2/4
VLGYLSGYLNLTEHMSWFGDTQFRNLTVLASVSLGVSVCLACVVVGEKKFVGVVSERMFGEEEEFECKKKGGVVRKVREYLRGLKMLPGQIWYILVVQFFAWMSTYPYLLYVST